MPIADWPTNWSVVKVTAQYKNPDGTPAQGRVKFNMNTPGRVINQDAALIVSPLQVVAELDAEGRIEIDLPSSNDPDVTPLFTWKVTEFFSPGNRLFSYEIEIPHDVTEVDLSHADEVTSERVIYRYVRRDGDTMTGYLTLYADPSENRHAATKQYVDQLTSESNQSAINLMNQHLASPDPHGDRAWSGQNTNNVMQSHLNAVDPHGDRAYSDGIVNDALTNAQSYTDEQIQDHTSAIDPHGDRAYSDGIVNQAKTDLQDYADDVMADHLTTPDPHGDRVYTDTEIQSLEGRSELYTDNAVQDHASAIDPHGDRAYADGITGEALGDANAYTDSSLTAHLNASDPHGDRAYADQAAGDAQSSAQGYADNILNAHVSAADPHGDRAYADDTFVPQTDIGVNVASLVGGKIPSSQIPAIAITETFVVSSEEDMLALQAQIGDIAIRTDLSLTFVLGANDPTILTNWYQILTPSDSVSSVNGETGDVVLGPSDVGADPAGSASNAINTHINASDPHGDRAYADSTFIPVSQIGSTDGVAPLENGIVPSNHLPEFMDGKTVLNGEGIPDVGVGVEGDFYIDILTWYIYGPKTTVWGEGTSLIGPAGADGQDGAEGPEGPQGPAGADGAPGAPGTDGQDGADGAPGQDGRSVLSGSEAPTEVLGDEGDFYIDTTTWEIYGPKFGTDWGLPTNLIGPQGLPGADGAQGLPGEDGAPGQDGADGVDGKTILTGTIPPTTEGVEGDFYIDTVAWEIYGPKTSGSWGEGTSLIGPQGEQGEQGEEGPQGPPGQDGAGSAPGIHNVLTYGAVGDGSTNDTASIQSALNQCLVDGGGEVFVPGQGRIYSIIGPLRIYRNTTLTLAPDAIIRRDGAGTMLLNGDAGQNFGGYTGHGNIVVQGGTWDANGVSVSSPNMAISIGHAENVTIRDTVIKDVPGYHAIEFNATRRSRAINVKCLGFIDTGSREFSEAIQIDLALGTTQFGGFGPYDSTPCDDIVVQGCTIDQSGTSGTTGWGGGIGSHSFAAGFRHTNIRIRGNYIKNVIQYGVRAYYWSDVLVSGNSFTSCGGGVRVYTPTAETQSRITVSDNTFATMGSYNNVVWFDGASTRLISDIAITGNIFGGNSGASNHGIRVVGVDGATVTGNVLRDITNTAISQDTANGVTIDGNRIYNAGVTGIYVNVSTQCVVSDNSVSETGLNGIHILGGSDAVISNNIVKAASRTTNGSGFGYRLSSGLDRFSLTGNRYSGASSGNQGMNAIGITNTCTNGSVWGNDLRGSSTTAYPFVDNSNGLNLAENISFSPSWFAYTPALTGTTTNPSVGSGYVVGSYQRYGNTVFFRASIVLGSGMSAGSGQWRLTLPTPFFSNPSFAVAVGIGAGSTPYAVVAYADVPTTGTLRFVLPTGGFLGSTGIGSNTWQSGNFIHISGTYEAG